MVDITMCKSKDCPISDSCYRFLATPCQYLQSYADFFDMSKDKANGCDMYMPAYDWLLPKKESK